MQQKGTGKIGRVLGYARVSSREQALGTSLQDQQDTLQAYAQARGLKVSRYFVEAESAVHEKFERREKMQQLMAELRPGDLVLCDKLDRWSRDPEFTYRSMREAGEAGARVYFVAEQIDPTTPEGDSMLNMRVMMAREEWKRIRLRTVGTRKLLRNQGLYVEGLAPIGYRRQLPKGQRVRGIEKNVLLPDETMAPMVVEFFELAAKGWSIGDLLVHAREKVKTRKWDKKSIHGLLRSRIYIGEIKDSNDIWIKARHAGIVTPSLFDRVQAGLDRRRLGGAKARGDSLTKTWLMRGFASCGRCGGRMGAAYGGGGSAEYVHYYRCHRHCGARLVQVKGADAIVGQLLLLRLIELRKELERPTAPTPATPTVDFAQRRANLEQRRDRLVEARIDGHLSREDLAKRMTRLDTERTKLDSAEAEQTRRSPASDLALRKVLVKKVAALQSAWKRLTLEEKRVLLAQLASTVKLQRDHEPIVVWRTIEEMAAEVSL